METVAWARDLHTPFSTFSTFWVIWLWRGRRAHTHTHACMPTKNHYINPHWQPLFSRLSVFKLSHKKKKFLFHKLTLSSLAHTLSNQIDLEMFTVWQSSCIRIELPFLSTFKWPLIQFFYCLSNVTYVATVTIAILIISFSEETRNFELEWRVPCSFNLDLIPLTPQPAPPPHTACS